MDEECEVTEERIVRRILEKLLVGLASDVERRPTYQERMRG
jgi:hypothetical protein